jgi:hypothetical protein
MGETLLRAPLKVVLEGKDKDTCPLLSQEHVARIPLRIYSVLSRECVQEDFGDMGIVVRVKDKKYYEIMKRALNWIAQGEAAKFLTAHKFDVIKREGDRKCILTPIVVFSDIMLTCVFQLSTERAIPYERIIHADDDSYSVAKTTRTRLAEDIEQYICSIEYEISDLRQYMSKKLSSYPVYAPEIIMLISNLYATNSKVTQHVDPEVAKFITSRINCFRQTLLSDTGVLAALRACISPTVELKHLSRHATNNSITVDLALHALRDAIGDSSTAEGLLQIFEHQHLSPTPTAKSPIVPVRPAHARLNPDNPLYDPTIDAVTTLNTIGEKRVVRAEQDGRGTLLPSRRFSAPPAVQNEGFYIARGQYLVLLPEQLPQVHGVNARVVCNDAGEIGELFENLRLTPIQETQSKLSSLRY